MRNRWTINIYSALIYIMIINSFVSLTNRFYPSSLQIGKVIGCLLILDLLLIYLSGLTRSDFLMLLFLMTFDFFVLFRLDDSSVDLENAIFFTSTCMMLWKFASIDMREAIKYEIELMDRTLLKAANILVIISIIALPVSSSWSYVNGQTVFFGFCESGHKFSGNMCFVAVLYLLYFSNKKFKMSQLLYFLIPLVLITLTGSRTYLVSYLIIMIILYYKKIRNNSLKWIIVPVAIIAVGYIVINSSIINRFILMGSNQYISDNFWEATSSGRLIWWEIDIDTFLNFDLFSKLFGKGFTFLYDLNQQQYGLRISAHNDFITLLVSSGIFGFIGYLIIIMNWFLKRDSEYKRSFIVIILTAVLFLWNAMISGAFGAQQYMFANVLLGVVFLENPFELHMETYDNYEGK